MNRVSNVIFWVVTAAVICLLPGNRTRAQSQQPAPASQAQAPNATSPSGTDGDKDKAKDAAKDGGADDNPFAPEPAPALPPGMTGSDASDPRAKLTPGLYDAGEAAEGLKHLELVKKPDAFQLGSADADDPKVKSTIQQLGIPEKMTAKMPKPMQLVIAQLAFANSDLAFQGSHLFQGNFYGVNIFDISNPANTKLLTTMVCPGGQGDVSVYKNLLFMSVEMPNGRIDCGTQGFPPEPTPPDEDKDKAADQDKDKGQAADAANDKDKGADASKDQGANADKDKVADANKDKDKGQERHHHIPAAQKDRFRGVRIFDISDIQNPKQVAAVQTCRGSHTHTLVVDPNDKDNVYIYVSGTSFVRQPEELEGCSGEKPDKDPNTALFRIEVIKVPLAAPQDAKIVSSPRVFMDARTGALNGLNNGGTHGRKGPEKASDSDQCHDITVYSAIGLAAGACSGNGILLDIKDPVHPKRVDAVNDPNYSYWHSASFSNDGTKVVFTDEWGGGLGARCRANDPNKWGADAIFNLKDDKLTFANYYKMPAAQGDTENCVAHNGSLIPVPGRDIEVQAWYQGGVSVMDFTDAAHPYEIAYFDRGPIDPKTLILGGDWSAYWYNGYIYGSEIARGLDVFELTPSSFLTQNEIDAAKAVRFNELNVQDQPRIEWPAVPAVANAYVDQLARSQALSAGNISGLRKAIKNAETSQLNDKNRRKLQSMAASLEKKSAKAANPTDAMRMRDLADTLKHLSSVSSAEAQVHSIKSSS
jgi:predicted  nucleic acid-binding Zn-ribbon protein